MTCAHCHRERDEDQLIYVGGCELGDDLQQLEDALAFQREAFRARFGCYPEEGVVVTEEDHEAGRVDQVQH